MQNPQATLVTESFTLMKKLGFSELADAFQRSLTNRLPYNILIHIAIFLREYFSQTQVEPLFQQIGASRHLSHLYEHNYKYNNKRFLLALGNWR